MLPWILAGCSVLSLLVTGSSLLLLRNKWKIDKETLAKMERDRRTEDEARERKRRDEDEARATERRKEDEGRYQLQREEMNKLARLANDRFIQWQDAISDLDELWQYVEDHMPWDREAMALLRDNGIPISAPPVLGRRHGHSHKDGGDDAGRQDR
jgi:hypothetical protein